MNAPEHELKFRLPLHRAGLIRRCLESCCDPDPRFPGGDVWSIYFDTPSFDFLREKLDGHCDKRKVRLRWYDVWSHAFLEIKYRFGASRDKLRIETALSPRQLSGYRLEDLAPLTALLEPLRMSGGQLPPTLVPMMTVRFHRSRFVDRASGSRLSVDEQITAPAANRRFFPGSRPDPLPFAVVEVKGPAARLPAALSGILTLGGHHASISKYAECYHRLCGRPS